MSSPGPEDLSSSGPRQKPPSDQSKKHDASLELSTVLEGEEDEEE